MTKRKDQTPGYGKILDAWIPPDDAGEPVGCLATSFTFSPVFFEEECLGRFLQLGTNATEDGHQRVRESPQHPWRPTSPSRSVVSYEP